MSFSVNESINAMLLIPIQLVNRQFLPLMTFSIAESINTVFAESRDSKLTVPVSGTKFLSESYVRFSSELVSPNQQINISTFISQISSGY